MLTILITFFIVVIIGYAMFSNRHVNPYIEIHKKKWQNERDYDNYIKWLDSKGGDLPLREVKMNDDLEVLEEVNKNFNK